MKAPVQKSVFEDAEGAAWEALLTAMGYHVAWKAPPGPDHGIDVVAYPDPLGAREPRVKVSVRRRSVKADVQDLREHSERIKESEKRLLPPRPIYFLEPATGT